MFFLIIPFFFLNILFTPIFSKSKDVSKKEENRYNEPDDDGSISFRHQFGFLLGYSLGSVLSNTLNISNKFYQHHFFSGGFFFNFSHVKFVRIQIELNYHQKGAKSTLYTSKMHIVSIPLLARFQADFGLLSNIGFAPSILVSSSVEDKDYPNFNVEEHLKKVAFDVVLGIGWRFKLKKEAYIFLESRFTYTLNNLQYIFSNKKTIHPFNWGFYLGFEFL